MPNGIDLLLADHRRVDELFARFDETADGTLVGQIVDALTAHDDAEHSALYPLLGSVLRKPKLVEDASRAHSAVKKQMDVLKALEGPALTAAVATLRELVQAHVADEEARMFPALAKAAAPAQLEELGARILRTKQRVG
jgi:hemerythrin superfamily protein